MIKSMQIGLLVVAGAIGGALLMKITHTPQSAAPAPPAATAAVVPLPAPAAPAPPAAEPAPEPAAPSPFPEKEKEREQARAAHRAHAAKPPETVAQNQPPAAPAPDPQAAPAPAQEPAKDTPAAPAPAPPPAPVDNPVVPPPPPPPPPTVTVKAGTLIPARTVEAISSDRNAAGDLFTATLDQPLIIGGFAIAERGAKLEGRVTEVQQSGRVKGVGAVSIELTRLTTSDGQHIAIQTDTFTKQAPKEVGRDAAKVGAAAGIGAAIGAIAGGGKGAAIGAAIGGAAGAGDVLYTRGKPAQIDTETRIDFRLREPVTITERQR